MQICKPLLESKKRMLRRDVYKRQVLTMMREAGLRILVFPFVCIIGTLIGSAVCGLLFKLSLQESLAIGAGFGWYSLCLLYTSIGGTVGKNFIKDPGLHRTLIGDGIGTTVAALFGAPANTTYGENTGVLALTTVSYTHL